MLEVVRQPLTLYPSPLMKGRGIIISKEGTSALLKHTAFNSLGEQPLPVGQVLNLFYNGNDGLGGYLVAGIILGGKPDDVSAAIFVTTIEPRLN